MRAEQIGSLALASYQQTKVNESTQHVDSSRDHLFGNQEFVMRIANLWVRHILQDDAACVRLPATEAVRDIMCALATPERQQIVLENALNTLCGKNKQSSTYVPHCALKYEMCHMFCRYSLRQTAIRLIYQLSLAQSMIVPHAVWKMCEISPSLPQVLFPRQLTHFSEYASRESARCWKMTSILSNCWLFAYSADGSLRHTGMCNLKQTISLWKILLSLMQFFQEL